MSSSLSEKLLKVRDYIKEGYSPVVVASGRLLPDNYPAL